MKYLIVSAKNTRNQKSPLIIFYRENRKGYTTNPNLAGRYNIDDAIDITQYSDGELIPIRESEIEQFQLGIPKSELKRIEVIGGR